MSPILVILLMPLAALAVTSADYALAPAVLDPGGLTAASADYSGNFSASPGGTSTSPNYALRGGFAGQLADTVGLTLADGTTALNERGSRQLGATLALDDSTTTALAPQEMTWIVTGGPLAGISAGGLVTAAAVYQNTAAGVRGSFAGVSATLQLTVANVTNDDFGSYAADGLADHWQVGHFGEGNPQAGPSQDADGDGLSNLQEFAFGTDPSHPSGGPVRWSGPIFQGGGVAVPLVTTAVGSFSFRAVFARRRDFSSAGLNYTVEFSGDLVTWKASTATPVVLAQDDELQAVAVPYPFFVNGKKASWFRVKVQSN